MIVGIIDTMTKCSAVRQVVEAAFDAIDAYEKRVEARRRQWCFLIDHSSDVHEKVIRERFGTVVETFTQGIRGSDRDDIWHQLTTEVRVVPEGKWGEYSGLFSVPEGYRFGDAEVKRIMGIPNLIMPDDLIAEKGNPDTAMVALLGHASYPRLRQPVTTVAAVQLFYSMDQPEDNYVANCMLDHRQGFFSVNGNGFMIAREARNLVGDGFLRDSSQERKGLEHIYKRTQG